MDFLTKIKDIFFRAGEFESEVDGVKVDLRESYVKLTNCGDGYKPEKCGPIVKENTRNMISEDSSDLPEGWTRFKLQRATGGICDTYVQNPEGKKFDRQKKIDQYLEKVKSDLKISFLSPPNTFKSGKTSDITKYMIKTLKAPSDKQPEASADLDIEEEKENICENLTKERTSPENVESPVADKSQQRNTKEDSTVSKVKRKAPNGETTKKRKKPNIVESLSVSLTEESKCQENSTSASEEEVNEDFNQSITSTCIEGCINISEVSDEFVAEEVAEADEGEDEEDTRASEPPPPAIDDLPPGWCRKEVSKVFSKNELIIIVQAPDGKQFDSQKKLNSYLARNKMQLKISIDGPIENRITPEEMSTKEKTDSISPEQDEVKEVKKRGRPKKEETAVTNRNLTNDDIDEDCDREFCHQDHCYIEEIDKFMKETGLNLKAFPPTKGDGNCWFRAIADQVVIQNIPDKARNHRALRLEVCDHVKMLPEDIRETTIAIVFNGKKRGLSELVARQRRAGQWVDNTGIMVLTTAHYLVRNIHLYSYPSETGDNARPYSLTRIEAGPGAEDHSPVTVFFYDKHYQTLQPDNTSQEEVNSSEKTE